MRRIGIALLFALGAGLTLGCQSPSKTEGPASSTATAPESSDLTWPQALDRSSRVQDVRYKLSLDLNETDSTFKGESRIEFNLTDNSRPLRLDFYEGKVSEIQLNGQVLPSTAKKTYWIELPTDILKKGANVVRVTYVQDYSRQGQGLHRFQDPETKQVFLYSQFETFDNNRFMPSFDQPDLRATLEMDVKAPATWEVITTTMESEKKNIESNRRHWVFPTTPKIATYLFSLHAGPYKVWKDTHKGLPLRLMARPSMAKYVPVEKWFLVTKQGLDFFNEWYAFPYPFKKYDQVIVPEFNAGAMENVAAVTFSEWYLSRSKLRRDQWRRATGTILHEMAHMWFGDIVTMKWWNDLWLNESFATYMASLAMAEATEFNETWQDFYASDKTWAYWQDSLSTTHPVEAPVTSVKDAFANFDGITYGKGAAVLKQMSAHMGAENFKNGIRAYLAKHAYGNTEMKDFIAALQSQTSLNLSQWSDRWFRQSGTDKVAALWTCEGDKLNEIRIQTQVSEGAKFRPQTITLGLYRTQGPQLVQSQLVPVTVTDADQSFKGQWACPELVYPNAGDQGYMSVQLDSTSLQTIKKTLGTTEDVLLRTMMWNDLWRMVRFNEMPLKDYIEIADRHFPIEKDEIILRQIVRTLSGGRSEESSAIYYWPENNEKSLQQKNAFIARLEKNYFSRFQKAVAGSDDQKFWFDSYRSVARRKPALDRLSRWLNQQQIGPGFPWDPDRRWGVIRKLTRYNHPQGEQHLAAMKKTDPSERGQKEALAADAIRPIETVKKKWMDVLREPKSKLSFQEAQTVMYSLFPVEQSKLAMKFETDYFDYLKKNGASENENFVENFADATAPLNCDAGQSQKLKNFVTTGASFSPSVKKALLIGIEEDERCQRVRGMSAL